MIGVYKQSKFLAEREVKRLVIEEGLPVVMVKPSAPFGPRDVKPTPTGRLIVEAAKGKMPQKAPLRNHLRKLFPLVVFGAVKVTVALRLNVRVN